MERFIQRFSDKVIGVLNGFDRIVFRGSLRALATHTGMREFLYQNGVLMKDFRAYSQPITSQLRELSKRTAERKKRPFIYLASSKTNKEEVALRVLKQQPVKTGLVCMLSCVEPGISFEVTRLRETKKIQMRAREKMCLHIYQYLIHPIFGFMNARIQTWFPFTIQLCINGREWLSQQMDRRRMKYQRLDNCFPWIKNVTKAQQLMTQQLQTNWPAILNPIARMLNPLHDQIFRKIPLEYYWTTSQTEWATDLMFKEADVLHPLFERFVPQAMSTFSSPDVMRFLGRKPTARYQGEIVSDFKNRLEGIRIKHRVGTNSVKAYDKFQKILRVETTINNPRDFRIFRPLENHPDKMLAWQKLRQGVADLHRRAEISQASNERYLQALAHLNSSTPLGQLFKKLSSPVFDSHKRFRALRPTDPADLSLFKAVADGRFNLNGFRNRDLQNLLFSTPPSSQKEKHQRSARISRLIRLLRAHHLVKRVPHSYRYLMTPLGREVITAIISMTTITLDQIKCINN
ncbi:hypothetical protein L0244_29860 [bacterium]|nr:hypothetical protein [bacterium]MCI0617204.1 hypothetical protein [bacterium]